MPTATPCGREFQVRLAHNKNQMIHALRNFDLSQVQCRHLASVACLVCLNVLKIKIQVERTTARVFDGFRASLQVVLLIENLFLQGSPHGMVARMLSPSTSEDHWQMNWPNRFQSLVYQRHTGLKLGCSFNMFQYVSTSLI